MRDAQCSGVYSQITTAPKPISQHVIISHAPATPQIDSESAPVPSMRHRVPKHLLRHRFLPYGAATSDENVVRASDTMELDMETGAEGKDVINGKELKDGGQGPSMSLPQEPKTPKPKKPLSTPQTSPNKTKKRKNVAGEESPKRSKKLKI